MVEESDEKELKTEAKTINVEAVQTEKNIIVEDAKQMNPSTAPQTFDRETLIATAVHFLLSPKVKGVPLSQKRAFLLRKGLTNEDVDIAFERVNMGDGKSQQLNSTVDGHSNSLVPYYQAGPVTVYQQPPVSLWYRWRELCSSLMVIGATFYGCYLVFKRYIEPLILGKTKQEEDRMSKIERHLNELNKSLTQLRHSLVCVESTLCKRKAEETLSSGSDSTVPAQDFLGDIRGDISSIKSLLLSRNQFPAAPTSSLSIPAWQLKQVEEDKIVAQNGNKIQEEEEEDEEIQDETKPENSEITKGFKEPLKISEEEFDKLSNGINTNGNVSDH